jgi:hypothetical protein
MGLNCRDCADHQQEIPAVTMVGKTPVCREHWRSRMGIPKKVGEQPAAIAPPAGREEGEVKQMAKPIDETTRAAILKDAAAGMNTNQIAEKHSIGWITAKNVISGNGKRRAGGGRHFCHSEAWTQAAG